MKSRNYFNALLILTLMLGWQSVTAQDPFITTWKTNNPGTSDSLSISIPIDTAYNYLFTVDWGDGNIDSLQTAAPSHTYSAAGVYDVSIYGQFPTIKFNNQGDRLKNIDVKQWGDIEWSTFFQSFYGAENLVMSAVDTVDLTQVASLLQMFRNAKSFNGDIGHWDVSNVRYFNAMFLGAKQFNQDISSWQLSSAIITRNMFHNAKIFNQDISNWDMASVVKMDGMFAKTDSFNQNISHWKVGNVTNMYRMFQNATAFDQNLGEWDISKVTSMDEMLAGATLSAVNYDSTLTAWAARPTLQDSVVFDGGNSQYCLAKGARSYLTDSLGWTITDGDADTVCQSKFITTWRTSNVSSGSSDSLSVQIPTNPSYSYDFTIDWGDGTVEQITTQNPLHTYADTGTYQVAIWGDFPAIYSDRKGDRKKLILINQWGNLSWQTMNKSFSGCSNMILNALDAPNLSNTNDLSFMFDGTDINQPINHWDVSTITNMRELFSSANKFNQNLSDWDVSNVTDMFCMLCASDFNQNLNNWDVSNVTNMSYMFFQAYDFNGDISSWNTSSTTSLKGMFQRARSFNQDIDGWDLSSANDISSMFSEAWSFNQDLNSWNVSNVTDMSYLFYQALSFNGNIGSWDVSNVTNMYQMFSQAVSFNQDIRNWDVSSVSDMRYMFYNTIVFNQDIGNWDLSSASDLSFMFYEASAFNQDISTWNVSNIENMSYMFTKASSFNQDISTWDVANVENMQLMFEYASNFNQDIGNWNVSNATNMRNMFRRAVSFNHDLSAWNVSNVTNMYWMFRDAESFDQNLGGWDVSNVNNLSSFLTNVTLSTANYDSLLIGWANLDSLNSNLPFGAGNSQYCLGDSARSYLTDSLGWTIYDGGLSSSCGSSSSRLAEEGVTDQNEWEQDQLVVYPNPTKDHVFISAHQEIKAVSVLDVQGRLIDHYNHPATSLSLKSYERGVYILTLMMEDGSTHRQVIVKE